MEKIYKYSTPEKLSREKLKEILEARKEYEIWATQPESRDSQRKIREAVWEQALHGYPFCREDVLMDYANTTKGNVLFYCMDEIGIDYIEEDKTFYF